MLNDTVGLSRLSEIILTLSKFPQVEKAVVFGSRAKGNFKPTSDIDIALYGNLKYLDTERVAEELDELPIIQKFDIVDYHRIDNSALIDHIDRVGITIFQR